MDFNFEKIMAKKSDEGLMEYVTNIGRYTPESIRAAVNELIKRGKEFTSEELDDIKQKIKDKIEKEKKEDEIWKTSGKENIVSDPNAPEYYSNKAIWMFSIIFTVIFGAVLLSTNLNDRKAKWIVISFGLLYATASIILLNELPRNTGLTFLLNAGGGLTLTLLFWNKYIGRDTQYRKKPIWKPLIISILIVIPFLLVVIYG